MRNVTLELAIEKDALGSLYGRDGAGLTNLRQVHLLYLKHTFSQILIDAREKANEVVDRLCNNLRVSSKSTDFRSQSGCQGFYRS